MPHAQVLERLQPAQYFVSLQTVEGLGLPALEAMAAGCLLVASDTAPVRELIEDGKNGLLVDFFDATQLAHRLADVLSRNKGMYSMRQQARQTIVDHYDLHTICLPGLLKFFAKTRNDC